MKSHATGTLAPQIIYNVGMVAICENMPTGSTASYFFCELGHSRCSVPKSKRHAKLHVAIYADVDQLESCSRDPIGYQESRFGLYEYASGNPLLRVDPSGNTSIKVETTPYPSELSEEPCESDLVTHWAIQASGVSYPGFFIQKVCIEAGCSECDCVDHGADIKLYDRHTDEPLCFVEAFRVDLAWFPQTMDKFGLERPRKLGKDEFSGCAYFRVYGEVFFITDGGLLEFVRETTGDPDRRLGWQRLISKGSKKVTYPCGSFEYGAYTLKDPAHYDSIKELAIERGSNLATHMSEMSFTCCGCGRDRHDMSNDPAK